MASNQAIFTILLGFILLSGTILSTQSVYAQTETKIIDVSKGKDSTKFHYIIINGGGKNDKDDKAKDERAAELEDILKDWISKGNKDSKVLPIIKVPKDKDEDFITDKIENLQSTIKPGEELVIFIIGHGTRNGDLELFSVKDSQSFLTKFDLADAISGFEKSVTISVITFQCFGDKLADTLKKEAKNDKKEAYGDHLFTIGGIKKTLTGDYTRGLKPTLSDTKPSDSKPDGDTDKDGVYTTDELEKIFKDKLKHWFSIKESDKFKAPGEESNCGIFPVGGKIIPIETTSLILAGAQSFSWMIPVVLSVIGIGLFVVSRKSENS